MSGIYSDGKHKMNIPLIPYGTSQTVCAWVITIFNKKMHLQNIVKSQKTGEGHILQRERIFFKVEGTVI